MRHFDNSEKHEAVVVVRNGDAGLQPLFRLASERYKSRQHRSFSSGIALMKIFCLLVLSWVTGGIIADAAEASRPNILYVYVDDMGWGSIGPNGQAERKAAGLPYVRTPNIDRLAAEGVNFRRAYACTVCSPSRASQQTGFHQGHAYADRNDPNNARKAIRADDISMGDVLAKAGYQTGYWGKWGYGGSKDHDHPTIDNVQTLPTSHGYKHVLAELHHVRAHTFFQPTLWHAPAGEGAVGGLELVPNSMAAYVNNDDYPKTPAMQGHPEYPKIGYCDDAYAFAALNFVREQAINYNKSKQPFFGLLAVQVPHAPFAEISQLPNWDVGYRKDKKFAALADQTKQWAAMVTRIDSHLGNLLTALEDPDNDGDKSDSVADNTLVIFQSDNGGPSGRNNVELNANGGLKGNKGKIHEGGIRVPLVMRWPAKINAGSNGLKPGSETSTVVDITDLLPTFCDLARTSTPVGIDGVSVAPTLLGEGHQRKRDFVIHEAGSDTSIIRGDFKLVRNTKNRKTLLYNLATDTAEADDVSKQHPELKEELETLLLGERVTEPKGFAATYHNWLGPDKGDPSDAANWSGYEYSNAGISYQTDDGAPQASWIARMSNTGTRANVATTTADLEFLALEIEGNAVNQCLEVKTGTVVTGRNEVRLAQRGELRLMGGTVASLRWLDIQSQGLLRGYGTAKCTVYNSGMVLANQKGLTIGGDYHQAEDGKLAVEVAAAGPATIEVSGEATLGGALQLVPNGAASLPPGQRWTLLSADRVTGKFSSQEKLLIENRQFQIEYSPTKVELVEF